MTAYDVIIVGAGLSGLAAAARLSHRRPLRILLLEARDRLGGRAHTIDLDGAPVDLGCSFIHLTGLGNPLFKLARDKLKLDFAPMGDVAAIEEDGRLMTAERKESVIGPLFEMLFGGAEEAAQRGPRPPSSQDSLGAFMLKVARERLEGADLKTFETLMRGASGYTGAKLLDMSFKYQGFQREFKGDDVYLWSGYQRIVEHFHGIARTNPHFHLGLGTPIAGLSYDEENERVRVLTKSGEAFEAAHVIVTASLGVLKEGDIAFSPALPPRRLRAIQSLGMGLLDKVVLQYDSVWWDMAEDACLIFIPSTPPLPLLRSLFVNSFAHRGKAILVLYINPEDAPAVEALSDAELANWAHPLLADRLPRAAQTTGSPAPPTRTMATRWLQDEYSRGSYSYMPVAGPNDGDDAPSPLDIIELSHALWDQRLGFAGEHTEVDHYSYAHGAIISGEREAKRIMAIYDDSDGI